MSRELSRWGVGPSIATTVGPCAAIAGLATCLWLEVFLLRTIPYCVFSTLGILLLLTGVPVLIVAGRAATILKWTRLSRARNAIS